MTKHSIANVCSKKSNNEEMVLALKKKEEQFKEAVVRIEILMARLEASQQQVKRLMREKNTTIHAREHEISHSKMMVKSNSGIISALNRKIQRLSQEKQELIEYQNESTVSSQMFDTDRYSFDELLSKSQSSNGTSQYGDWIENDWRNMANKSDAEKTFTGSLGKNLAYCRGLVQQIKANLERNNQHIMDTLERNSQHVKDNMEENGFGDNLVEELW
ncbi:hypothetical protein WDU94_001135 [Cyamophila willieti]